jgi:hypothetical protein
MLLGDIIRDLTDEHCATGALVALGDLPLLAQIETARTAHGETAGAYAANAVARFADGASDEDWLGLMNAVERTDDPAGACLRRMIEWSLKQDAEDEGHSCSCGHTH